MKVSYVVGAMGFLACVAGAAVNGPAVLVGALATSLAVRAAAASGTWKPVYDPHNAFPGVNKGDFSFVMCSDDKLAVAAVDMTQLPENCPPEVFAEMQPETGDEMYKIVCQSDDQGAALVKVEQDVKTLCDSGAVIGHVLNSALSGDGSEPKGAVADAFGNLMERARQEAADCEADTSCNRSEL